MLNFEVINELSLKVTCTGNDVLFTKAGAFIAGESQGGKNYRFEKLLLGPQSNLMQAALGSLTRRVTRENLPLMKVTMNGDSVTYYANHGQHVVVYKLAQGEILSVESENILAFTQDCDYSVRFIGCGIFSQKGLATSTLTGAGPNAYVAVLADGNPIAMDNTRSLSFTKGTSGNVLLLDFVFVVSDATITFLPSTLHCVTVCRITMVFSSKSIASHFRPTASLRRNP